MISRPYLLEHAGESSFNFIQFFMALAFISVLGYMGFRLFFGWGKGALGRMNNTNSGKVMGVTYGKGLELTPTAGMDVLHQIYATQTSIASTPGPFNVNVSVTMIVPTEIPTMAPAPTLTPLPTIALEDFYYSSYYPDNVTDEEKVLIDEGTCPNSHDGVCSTVNCWDYSVADKTCKSKMTSGEPWQAWVDRAVACSYDFPLGTKFRVVDPPSLAGEWICMDRGGDIQGSRLDFLQVRAVYSSWGIVRAQVEK